MHDLKIYIVIEDPRTKHDLSIKGNFEILRIFLNGISGTFATELHTQVDVLPISGDKEKV